MATCRQDAFLREVLVADIKGYLADEFLSPRVVRTDGRGSARTVKFPMRGGLTLTTMNYASDTQAVRTVSNPDSTSAVVTINQHPTVSVGIPLIDMQTVDYDNLPEGYKQDAAKKMAEAVDANVFGLYGSMGTNVGTCSTAITEAYVSLAKRKLDQKKAPGSDRSLILGAIAANDIVSVSRFSDVEKYGPNYAIKEGSIGRVYGFDVYMTNQVTLDTTTEHNLAIHKFVAGLAWQNEIDAKIWWREMNRAWIMSVDADYGYGMLTASLGVQVKSIPS